MTNRRAFVRTIAGTAGALALGFHQAAGQNTRRQVSIGGRRIRVIDIHCHCVIDVSEVVKGTPLADAGGGGGNQILGPQRLALMDKTGVDVQALTINGFWWYAADRDLAQRIVRCRTRDSPNGSRRILIALSRWHPWRCSIPIWRRSSSKMASSVSACAARRLGAT
jgi:hypothetical protein